MPSIEEILEKKKSQVQKLKQSQQEPTITPIKKKIARSGATRPWQENLEKYQSQETKDSKSNLTSLVGTLEKDHTLEPLAMREQTVSITAAEPLAIREQTVSNIESDSVSKKDSVSNAYAEALAEPLAMREQTVSNAYAKSDFESLVGKEKKLLFFVFKKCQLLGALETSPITTEELRQLLEVSAERLRNVIFRLSQKDFLEVTSVKNGRSGWRKFKINKELFQRFCLDESVSSTLAMREQTVSIASPKAYAEPLASSPVVVVSSNFKNTTTTQSGISDEPCFVIPQELSGKVSRRQLSEFVLAGKISEYDLQLSLDAFAYDLKQNAVQARNKNNPIAILIGAIKNNGSYNSAKYAELLKSELRPFIESQREASAQKQELKASKEWEVFQTFKQENPDDYKNLEQKVLDLGFKGALLEEFTYLEYKKEVLKVGEELNLNPLRPMEHITS